MDDGQEMQDEGSVCGAFGGRIGAKFEHLP